MPLKFVHDSAPALLQSVLTATQNAVLVYQAVRSTDGRVADLRLMMLNAVAEQHLGRPSIEVFGQSIDQLFPHLVGTGLFDRYKQVVETGQSAQFEFQYTRPNYPKPFWCDVSVVKLDENVVVSYKDITKTKADAEAAQLADVLQQAFNASLSGITVLEAIPDEQGQITDFKFVMINEAGLRMSGYTNEELIGRTLWAIYPSTRINGLFDQYVAVYQTGQPFTGEHYYPEYDQWRKVTIVRVAQGIMITYIDNTAQRKAEELIKKQTELLESISNNTPVGLVLWEAVRDNSPERTIIDFRYRMSNLMNTYVTGQAPETLIGKDLLTLFPRFRGTELETLLRETLDTGRTHRMVFTYYTEPPGGWFDAQFNRVGDGQESNDLVLMTFMDVTELHKGQLVQKAQADLMETVLDAQPSGIVLFQPVRAQKPDGQSGQIIDFTYVLVNETQVKVTGLPAHELIGRQHRKLFPSEQGQEFFNWMVEVAETGQTKEWLLPYFSDGINGWFQSSLIRHGDQVLFTFLDVSGLKRQQQALEIANIELKRSNDNLSQFASIASHDLQEPLRKIQAFGSLLVLNHADILNEEAQDMITRMTKAAERMSLLVRDLLDYSYVSTQRAPFTPVSMGDLMQEVLDDLALAVLESGAVVEWSDLPVVSGDKEQLWQLFQNLFSNAIKFHRPTVSPRVTVTSRKLNARDLPPAVADTIKLMAPTDIRPNLQFHEINVADNGIGFDLKYLDQIFQIFQRLHGRTTYTGTGIGLAICRKVVENHSGALTATSQIGSGSTFQVYLPIFDT
ncbi:PAS domain-containing sensor histidine kinase [Spirosoma aerophilum]